MQVNEVARFGRNVSYWIVLVAILGVGWYLTVDLLLSVSFLLGCVAGWVNCWMLIGLAKSMTGGAAAVKALLAVKLAIAIAALILLFQLVPLHLPQFVYGLLVASCGLIVESVRWFWRER
jgi:hypothetical protein